MMESNRQIDEGLLIDFLLGRCDADQAEAVRARLERDEGFRRLCGDVSSTFAALDLAIDHEPPEGLVADTMRRIGTARRTDALLAREELNRRDVIRPTFSLRELGAIAGVALLIFSIMGVSYREARRRKERTQCGTQVARLGSGLLTYANKNDGYLPTTGLTRRRWLPSGEKPAVSNSKALFRLLTDGFVEPRNFQCPAVAGGSFVYKAGMIDFPDSKSVSYSDQYAIAAKGVWLEDPALAKVKQSMAILADSTPLFPNGRFVAERLRAAVSENHGRAGMNVLYLDMHVEFRNRPVVGVNGDHIYLAGNIKDYSGEEAPARPDDTFLLPAFSNDGIVQYEEAPSQPSGPTN